MNALWLMAHLMVAGQDAKPLEVYAAPTPATAEIVEAKAAHLARVARSQRERVLVRLITSDAIRPLKLTLPELQLPFPEPFQPSIESPPRLTRDQVISRTPSRNEEDARNVGVNAS
ncbi:MAG: hypothetical protein ACFB9M_12465 [Myxococcota bacterium]